MILIKKFTMKKIIIYISIFLFSGLTVFAQKHKEGREKIRTLKIAYITEQLNLTPKEAQKFWPIYNTFDSKQHSLRSSYRFLLKKSIKENGSIDNITEEESEKIIALKLDAHQKLYEIEKDFIQKMKGIISYKKILKLQMAEMEFGKKLMRKYRHKEYKSKN